MKYQCNSCGAIYDYRDDAVNCHPDINEIEDGHLESRLAAQQVTTTTKKGAQLNNPAASGRGIRHSPQNLTPQGT